MTARNRPIGIVPPVATDDGTAPPKQKRSRRLRTLAHVRGGLASVIRALEAGSMDPKQGNALVYAYSTLAGVMSAGELEELRREVDAINSPPPAEAGDAGGRVQ